MKELVYEAPGVKMHKTKSAQPAGEYKPTEIDRRKAEADFRLVDVSGRKNRIVWKDGRREDVTDRQLSNLQALHPNWMSDF